MTEPKCRDCDAAMTAGLTIDRADYDIAKQMEWVPGEPEVSKWLGGLKLKGKERLKVVTYRCSKCGLLKSYAHPD